MHRTHQELTLFALALTVMMGCAGPQAGTAGQPPNAPPSTPAASRKSITIALRGDINALVGDAEQGGRNTPPSVYVQEFVNAYLTVRDPQDQVQPQIAARLPSLDDGTWKLLDDGSMEVTWNLRPDVQWQDGTSLTADDVAFGWEVASDPATPFGKGGPGEQIQQVDVLDPTTLVMTWKSPSAYGGELGTRELPILPRHLLGQAFLDNKETFHENPYFVTAPAFVGSGAYRPVDWERDSYLTVEAFDGYFLGRPKIDQITFRFIPDSRTALASVLSGAVDISYLAVEFNEAKVVDDQWTQSGAGIVWYQPNQLRMMQPQMRPEYAKPVDIALNPDVRRALAYAMDRQAIAEAANPGAAMVVDSDGVPGTTIGDEIRAKAVHYDYDPARAQAMLADAGWQRDSDGMLEKDGQPFHVGLLADPGDEQDAVFSVLHENYLQIGIDSSLVETSSDIEPQVTYPGIRHRGAFTNYPGTIQSFVSSRIASAATHWAGQNLNGYDNPALDQVVDQLGSTVRTEERMADLAEAWRIVTADAGTVALYIRPVPYVIRKGISGPIPASLSGSLTSNVQSWDVQ